MFVRITPDEPRSLYRWCLVMVLLTEWYVGWWVLSCPRLYHARPNHAVDDSAQREHTGRYEEHHLPRLARLLQKIYIDTHETYKPTRYRAAK